MKTKLLISKIPKKYSALLGMQMLRPLHDRIDYENAMEILAAMAGHSLNSDQEDYFDTLSLLVEAYEAARSPAPSAPNGLTVLRHLLDESGMSAADLARMHGHRLEAWEFEF